MSGGFKAPVQPVSAIPAAIAAQAAVIRELSKPTAAQIYKSLEQIQQLVEDLITEVDSIVTTLTYDRPTIDSKDAAVLAVANGKVPLGSSPTFPDVFVTNAPNAATNNITGSRTTAWYQNSNGWLGNTASTERLKTNIRPTDIDPLAVLSVEPVYYQWIESVQERERRAALPEDDPEYEADMHVHTEVGMIAERLHAAGLWQFVEYERNSDESLILNDQGDAVPYGIHYINWGIALQVVARYLHERMTNLEARVDQLERGVAS